MESSFLFIFPWRVRVEMISNEALSCNWKIPTAEKLAVSATDLTMISLHWGKSRRTKPYFFLTWYYAGFRKMSSEKNLARTSGFCCRCQSPQSGSDGTLVWFHEFIILPVKFTAVAGVPVCVLHTHRSLWREARSGWGSNSKKLVNIHWILVAMPLKSCI